MKKKSFLIISLFLFSVAASEDNLRDDATKRTADQAELPQNCLPFKKRKINNNQVVTERPETRQDSEQPFLVSPEILLQAAFSSVIDADIPLRPIQHYQCLLCMGIFPITKEEHEKVCYTLNSVISCPVGCGRTFKRPIDATRHSVYCRKKK